MSKFIDLTGAEWDLSFTMAQALDASCPVDLLDIEALLHLMANPREFVKFVLWLVQSEEELSQFGRRFDGKVLDDARNAFWEALESFTPPERRAAIRGVKAEAEKVANEVAAMLEKALAKSGSDLLSKLADSLE